MDNIINARIIICKCSSCKKVFGMRTEETGYRQWMVNWAFPISDKRVKSEKYDLNRIEGSFSLASEYPGCPYCGNRSFFSCGKCGKLTCWDSNTVEVTCSYCGVIDKISGTISSIDVGGDV